VGRSRGGVKQPGIVDHDHVLGAGGQQGEFFQDWTFWAELSTAARPVAVEIPEGRTRESWHDRGHDLQRMIEKYTHFAMFACHMAHPPCADECGLLKWREGFEQLPEEKWTQPEKWIHELEQAIAAVVARGPAGTVRTGGFRKPEDKKC
jgi:hypothetical protein